MSVDLKKFEQKIDDIITKCTKLQKENLSLKKRESEFLNQRNELIEKHGVTLNRLENLIKRLKNFNNEN
tara:strand:- start:715 stop:921 length:207 start_codon:yes stop_codon:yes gene_type:complete